MKTAEEKTKDKYIDFLRGKITECTTQKFTSLKSCSEAYFNMGGGLFDVVLNNVNHDLFERNMSYESIRLSEYYAAINRYVTATKAASPLAIPHDDYTFLEGVESYTQGILWITGTANYLTNNTTEDLRCYRVAFAGDCMEEIFNILTNEW